MRYNRLKYKLRKREKRARAARGLLRLRAQLAKDVPEKDSEKHLLLASWNIRDFGKNNPFGAGPRTWDAKFLIAETIRHFDLVAVQEVSKLDEWDDVMDLLGDDWDYICSEVTDFKLGGNQERLLYVYDRRKVKFAKIAGEIVLSTKELISKVEFEPLDDSKKAIAGRQFARTPYLTRWESGWLKFELCTVHILYGSASGEKLDRRVEEIEQISKEFGKRAKKLAKEYRASILLGDFNIVAPEHKTMKALRKHGFKGAHIQPTNMMKSHFYDQIAFYETDFVRFPSKRKGGVFDFFESVFRPEDMKDYKEEMEKCDAYDKHNGTDAEFFKKKWRTWQLSDHLVLWTRVEIDDADNYLKHVIEDATD